MAINVSIKTPRIIAANASTLVSSQSQLNVTIKTPRVIVANSSSLVSSQSQPPITLNNSQAGVSQNYLSHLLDVDASHPVDGEVLTYNANTGKYDLAPVTFTADNVNLDAGSF